MSDVSRMAFVGGPHRSGTTMLAALLARHPQVSGLANTGVYMDEGQFLQDVYPVEPALQPGFYAVEERAHLLELNEGAAQRAAERLRASWDPYWNQPGARLLVEKSPPNMLRSRFLGSVFPDALQIYFLRDPLVVALATQKWSYTSITACVHHTMRSYRILFNDLLHVSAPWLVVRYERLTDEPLEILSAILDAAGLDISAMPGEAITQIRPTANDQYLRTLNVPPFTPGRLRVFNRARTVMRHQGFECSSTAAEAAYVRKAFGQDLKALGYASADSGPGVYSTREDLPHLSSY